MQMTHTSASFSEADVAFSFFPRHAHSKEKDKTDSRISYKFNVVTATRNLTVKKGQDPKHGMHLLGIH